MTGAHRSDLGDGTADPPRTADRRPPQDSPTGGVGLATARGAVPRGTPAGPARSGSGSPAPHRLALHHRSATPLGAHSPPFFSCAGVDSPAPRRARCSGLENTDRLRDPRDAPASCLCGGVCVGSHHAGSPGGLPASHLPKTLAHPSVEHPRSRYIPRLHQWGTVCKDPGDAPRHVCGV
jgi:hypothetical protein